MFAYHEATKHSIESLRRRQHVLEWDNMPDPFRHYEGVPVVDLPAGAAPPGISMMDVLRGTDGPADSIDGAQFLSRLLFYSASISASKVVPSTGYRYALRVNPSSGNLHPTEFHFATRGLTRVEDGLYHYRVSSHMAEQRARGAFLSRLPFPDPPPLVFILSSIVWREAWKYQDRAYRYCLHDIGHAWQALALSARALGCEGFATGHFHDDAIAEICGFGDEWPMLLIAIRGKGVPVEERPEYPVEWLGGEPNRLSADVVPYPLIDAIHEAAKIDTEHTGARRGFPSEEGTVRLPEPSGSGRGFGEVVRNRRSALNFRGGAESIAGAQLSALLDAACSPLDSDFAVALIHLYLYVHRVTGIDPGVYRYWPATRSLQQVKRGDQQVWAAGLSLGQELAGTSCVTFSMIGDLERAANTFGNRGYRYTFFEAGAIGHRLYLASEALGFSSTGIGAFYDDSVHRYLDIQPVEGQVVYHFASGFPVSDPRLDAR